MTTKGTYSATFVCPMKANLGAKPTPRMDSQLSYAQFPIARSLSKIFSVWKYMSPTVPKNGFVHFMETIL